MMPVATGRELRSSVPLLVVLATVLFGPVPTLAQPTFTNAVLPGGVPGGATGSNVLEEPPLFYDPAAGDYRPDKPAGSPLIDLAGDDAPRDGRLLNGQTQTADGWDAGALESTGAALPVELSGFSAATDGGAVQLTWTTASESGNAGFRVQRHAGNQAPDGKNAWTTIGSVGGAGTTNEAQRYRFTDESPPFAAERLRYRLVQVDVGGSTTATDPVIVERGAPGRVRLLPPSPNPAQSAATVRLTFPEQAHPTEPQVAVFDVLGRRVASHPLEASGGKRRVVRLDVSDWPSGSYFVRLQAGGTTRTERLTVVR